MSLSADEQLIVKKIEALSLPERRALSAIIALVDRHLELPRAPENVQDKLSFSLRELFDALCQYFGIRT